MLNIQLLLTGNELMSGDITDTNSVFIARELKNLGVEATRKVTVGDSIELLIAEMNTLSQSADVLIVNGGLGPTVDDLTAQALSEVCGKELTLHPLALEDIKQWCFRRNFRLSGPNLKQAMLPARCDIIHNPIGSAPGFSVVVNDCLVICTPGVPGELKPMMRESIIPIIKNKLPAEYHTVTKKLKVFGVGESTLQKLIDETYPDWPEEIELGFRAAMPLLEVKLTSRQTISHDLRELWYEKLKGLLGQHIVSEDGKSLAATVVSLLNERKQTISMAESCTGGMIASEITAIAGSSNVFEAGYVTYSNRIKSKLVNVSEKSLETYGAVSEQVVREMTEGALKQSGSDYAIAVSGVAGPDGGTDEKPVGTVWLGWGNEQKIHTQKLYFPATRKYFQTFMANAGLDLIRRMILEFNDEPRYVVERQQQSKAD